MTLKYKQLITDQELAIACPPEDCQVNKDLKVARWVTVPLENEMNFLPNHLYLQKKGVPPRAMDNFKKCGYCSISLHTSTEASKLSFQSMSEAIRSKIGYTHVASGTLTAGAGLATPVESISQHFELFEFENFNWIENFKINAQLS